MELSSGLHLAYCTNVHRGENWAQTFDSLRTHFLAVKREVVGGGRFAIGLRLSDTASRELIDPSTLLEFRRWMDQENCYVFTINGFPYGQFHGVRVKEQVYRPDWTTQDRLDYTCRLFDILSEILPPGVDGSVSTLPGSFKPFIQNADQPKMIRTNIWRCVEHIAALARRRGQDLHLGVEPEPLGWFETSEETCAFFDEMAGEHEKDERLSKCLGVNYDTCHLAVEFEKASEALDRFARSGVRISKLHLSSALRAPVPDAGALAALSRFADDVYLHQVVTPVSQGGTSSSASDFRESRGGADARLLQRYLDLPNAIAANTPALRDKNEWRIHFHIPLHAEPASPFLSTTDHLLDVFDYVKRHPKTCTHLEMETYTWEVLPGDLKSNDVAAQLVKEYQWCLGQLSARGFQSKV